MPDDPAWIIEKLHAGHNRNASSCGVAELDDYLKRFANQNQKSGVSRHFVAVAGAGENRVLGYYALSAGAVAFEDVPDDLRKRLLRYPIPVAHLGRLAVDSSTPGRGLGEDLLINAFVQILGAADRIGIHAIEVIAIDDWATRFYRKYGFTPLLDDDCHLYLPLSVVRKLDLA